MQLTSEEKKRYAIEIIGEITSEELSRILSVSKRTINKWTKKKRESLKEERNRKILEEYLKAWNTQDDIAKSLGIPQPTIS